MSAESRSFGPDRRVATPPHRGREAVAIGGRL